MAGFVGNRVAPDVNLGALEPVAVLGDLDDRDATGEAIADLTSQMQDAARALKFELAGRLRDEIADLKKELRGMVEAGL